MTTPIPPLRAIVDDSGRTVYPQFEAPEIPLDVVIPSRRGRLKGAFSDVYRGEWIPTLPEGRRGEKVLVAVKELRAIDSGTQDDDKKYFERTLWREANILGQLTHRNILRLFGLCRPVDMELCLVMPWVSDSMTLSKFLERYPTANHHALMSDVASALQYLHGYHLSPAATTAETSSSARRVYVIHGDIHANVLIVYEDKSGNCMEGTYKAMLCDFGLSKVVAAFPNAEASYSMANGVRHGVCLAPELMENQKIGKTVRSKESDVFAYGTLVHRAYSMPLEDENGNPTEKDPLDTLSPDLRKAQILAGDRHGRPPRADCTDAMWKLVQQCWAQSCAEHPTMDEVVARLPSCKGPLVAQTILVPRVKRST